MIARASVVIVRMVVPPDATMRAKNVPVGTDGKAS
jgi:hypothetical protein